MMSRYDRAVRSALAITAVALTGCGRLEFDRSHDAGAAADSTICVPVGHDEDGDSVDDACDPCPARGPDGAELDTDGDGVGDECDISPLVQVREVFDPFTAMRSDVWATMGGVYTGDAVRFDNLNAGAGARMTGTPGRETFEITGNLVMGNPAEAQVLLDVGDGGAAFYFCELYDGGADVHLSLTYTLDGVNYMQLDTALLPGRFDTGPFRLILDHDPPMTTCYGEWGGQRVSVSGSNPQTITAANTGVGTYQVQVDLTSFTRLSTP
jgi:hypothetical protein